MTTRRIYFVGDEDDLACEEGDCENTATYRIEDKDTGEYWEFCAEHKDKLKAEGWAE